MDSLSPAVAQALRALVDEPPRSDNGSHPLQRDVCRAIADTRIRLGESYVAGGAALNELLAAPRVSRDVDLFNGTDEALAASWQAESSTPAARLSRLGSISNRPDPTQRHGRGSGTQW